MPKLRVALFVVCPLLFLLTVLVTAQQAPPSDTVVNPLANNPAAIASGQQLFANTCAICHGPAATGDRDRGGPALNVSGLKRGDGDDDLFRTIKSGVAGTPMPSFGALSDVEVWQIVAYLRSLQGASAPVSAGGAAGAPLRGDAAAGEAVFYGAKANCAACHEVNGRGGILAPDLSNAGRLDAAAIRQKIVSPNAGAPAAGRGGAVGRGGGPITIVATRADGRMIRGVRRNEDTFSLQMVDTAGALHLLDKRKLRSVVAEQKSIMPDDFAQRLTSDEITNLVAFLATQKGRDETKIAAQPLAGGLTYERLLNAKAEPHNWLMYWGNYQGTHYSPLSQITTANVSRLRPAWTFPITGTGIIEGTPLVVDGVMYATGYGNPSTVVALDARTGREIWRWTRQQKVVNPYQINPYSRGVAMLGNRVFVGTLDAALIALDARTGRQLWEVVVADTMEGLTITSPPLVLEDKVIIGTSGGEYATRGRLDAYDAATGRHLWRFYSVPGPGEPGNDTWKGDSWKTGGGPTWLTGTFDAELSTIYWPIGNPASQMDRSVRGDGDNLYTDAVVALDPDTGKLKWHYQFTPNDGHDWDATEDLVLVDRVWRGRSRKLLMQADRNGHFYVLDRTNGAFLSGTPFVYQNWNTGFTPEGRPIPVPGSNSSPDANMIVYPAAGGGTNWQSPSYSALTGWFYLEFSENGQQYVSVNQPVARGQQYLGRGRANTPAARGPRDPEPNVGVKAIDPETGKTMWQFPIFQGSNSNGVLATGGNLVFASVRDGNLIALDSKTGTYLWHYQTGSQHAASAMSYAVDGTQYIGFSSGNVIFAFSVAQ
jgi:alcohol dehydrogenase (cytochrome c)